MSHILKVNFELKFESVTVKSIVFILKTYTNYKTDSVYDKFLKIKILEIVKQLLSNF